MRSLSAGERFFSASIQHSVIKNQIKMIQCIVSCLATGQ